MTTLRNPFLRGVSVGGWLLLERFITPYMFALTDCHVQGDLCWFPGQISAPPLRGEDHEYCDMFQCNFLLDDDGNFVADDEHSLASQFKRKSILREYLSHHWENFVTREDIEKLKEAGVTHIRVPIPHWIMGNIADDEPYVNGQWLYFIRLVGWCRDLGIEVWPDIQTAPGVPLSSFPPRDATSATSSICLPWSESSINTDRSLQAVKDISDAILRDNLEDVVTGLGVLNVPFRNCDENFMKGFYDDALRITRETLGENTAIFIGDMLNASQWNDGFWTDEEEYSNTFLESSYYHVLTTNERSLSPKEHIELVCETGQKDIRSCCYGDSPKNKKLSKGIARLVGGWSASFDTEPIYKVSDIMSDILKNKGDVSEQFRVRAVSKERNSFMENFVKAQMVSYEAANPTNGADISRGWFFRTLKTEFAAFVEWDFLSGVENGWIPSLPDSSTSSASTFGTCQKIKDATVNNQGIIHEFPDPSHLSPDNGVVPGDDFEEEDSTGKQGLDAGTTSGEASSDRISVYNNKKDAKLSSGGGVQVLPMIFFSFLVWGVWKVFFNGDDVLRGRRQYMNLDTPTQMSV